MNRSMMARVADVIEANQKQFDMTDFFVPGDYDAAYDGYLEPGCGSAGCIGGWTAATVNDGDTNDAERVAAEALDLSPAQAKKLFGTDGPPYGRPWWEKQLGMTHDDANPDRFLAAVTAEDAVRVLRGILSGDIDL